MNKQKRVIVFCVALVAYLAITGIAAFQSQHKDSQKRKKTEYPIVDYSASQPTDLTKREKRRKKGEKYNNAVLPIKPSPGTVFQNIPEHFPAGTAALPVSQSAAVIIGTVTDAQAHLSPDKSYVYSEFDVLIDEVVKNDDQSPLTAGKSVAVERPGGRVKVPSGSIHEYRTTLNPLDVGSRYTLFLVYRGKDYQVFTGYRMQLGRVFPLDDITLFSRYENAGEQAFLADLHQAAGKDKQPSSVDHPPSMIRAPERPIEPDPPPEPDPGGDCQLPQPPACVTPRSDLRPRFSSGTVTVTYNPDHFSPDQVKALQNGYMVWNGLGGVMFTELTANRTRPPEEATNTLHFESADVVRTPSGSPRDAIAYPSEHCDSNGRCRMRTLVVVRRGVQLTEKAWCQNGGSIEWNFYEQLISHETGHPLGLADTYTDTQSFRGNSVMDGPSYHLRNGITVCDREAVRQAYASSDACPKSSTVGVYSICPDPTPTPTPPPGGCTDQDRDGVCYFDDCDDNNPYVAFDSDGDHYCYPEDCNDYDAGIHPGTNISRVEWYGEDRNCNGTDDFIELYGNGGGGGGGGGSNCVEWYWYYYESRDGGRTWHLVDVQYAFTQC